jgi:hypothetical protein
MPGQNVKTYYKTPEQQASDNAITARHDARVAQNRQVRDETLHPESVSTVDKIKRAASSAGHTATQVAAKVGGAVNKVVTNPTVVKAGRVVQSHADTFQKNISTAQTSQAPRQSAPHKKGGKKPRMPSGGTQGNNLAAQQDPFNIRAGNGGDPFGIHSGIIGGGKKKPPGGQGNNPFGL